MSGLCYSSIFVSKTVQGGIKRAVNDRGIAALALLLAAILPSSISFGQTNSVPAPGGGNGNLTGSAAAAGVPLKITLKDALARAKAISPDLERAISNAKSASEDRVQARAANLPSLSYNAQYLYTEGNGTLSARFIANNGVHEYISLGDAHEMLSATQMELYKRSIATEALARDEAAISSRGLSAAVVQAYATVVASQDKYKTLQQALQAAQNFLNTTRDLERGGEVAQADVVKAQIQMDDSQVELANGQLALANDRAALALLLFENVNQPYDLVDDPAMSLPLPPFDQVQAEALDHNPQLEAAFQGERAAQDDIVAARTGYLPTLSLDYLYGIDANTFSTQTILADGRPIQNLGYSAWAQLNLPIWNWGTTHSKVKQAEYREEQAAADRAYASRKLTTDLNQFYKEASLAKAEVDIRRGAASDAEQSLSLTLLRYKAGEATALEVVDAQNSVSLERNAFDDAKTRLATALANLATLTGAL